MERLGAFVISVVGTVEDCAAVRSLPEERVGTSVIVDRVAVAFAVVAVLVSVCCWVVCACVTVPAVCCCVPVAVLVFCVFCVFCACTCTATASTSRRESGDFDTIIQKGEVERGWTGYAVQRGELRIGVTAEIDVVIGMKISGGRSASGSLLSS